MDHVITNCSRLGLKVDKETQLSDWYSQVTNSNTVCSDTHNGHYQALVAMLLLGDYKS